MILYTASTLFEELIHAKQIQGLPQFVKHLMRYEALIVDGLGYMQYNRQEMEVFFHLLVECYERGSLWTTCHLTFRSRKRSSLIQ